MSWRRYPAYKPSGVEWLGEVPAHWDVKPLKALLSRNDGGVWGADFDDDGVIVLRSTEQTVDGQWVIANPARRRLTAREASAARLEIGDLVVTKSSGSELHIGKTSIVDESVAALKCCFSNFMQRLRVAQDSHPRYVWYLLNSLVGREQLVFLSSTTTGLGNLNGAVLGAIRAPVGSLPEQRSIAAFLDRETARIDALVAKMERLIELLQEKRSALISRAVTKGLDPGVPMKDSGVEWLGEIPAHWEVRRLKWCVSFYGGGTPSKANTDYWNGDVPWVSPKDMKSEVVIDTEDHITEQAVVESATRLIPSGAMLIVVRSGILRHSIPVAVNARPVTINQDMKALVPGPAIDAHYLRHLIGGNDRYLLVEWRKQGATVESIEHELLANARIPVPDVTEQRLIAAFLNHETAAIDALIAKGQGAIVRLQEYRTALISAAVTGKIDVRGEVESQ